VSFFLLSWGGHFAGISWNEYEDLHVFNSVSYSEDVTDITLCFLFTRTVFTAWNWMKSQTAFKTQLCNFFNSYENYFILTFKKKWKALKFNYKEVNLTVIYLYCGNIKKYLGLLYFFFIIYSSSKPNLYYLRKVTWSRCHIKIR
jgi:hypothetical protein